MQRENSEDFNVLIIADNPSLEVLPTTYNKSWALQKIGGFTLLDFCLEWASWFDSPNVVVASSKLDSEICQIVKRRWDNLYHGNIHFVTFTNCQTVNDVLREVESRRLLNDDFILIDNIATFCSSNLSAQLPAFKSRLKQNKYNILTLLFSSSQAREAPVLGLQDYSNKLILYHSKLDAKRRLKILKSQFATDTVFRSDLSPCGISLCAHEFSSHFSGNYDFQNFDGIIHDILSNEEFLGQNIHVENVNDVVAFSANNYSSLLKAHTLLIQRACFPLTFDNVLPFFKDFDRLELRAGYENVYVTSSGSESPLPPVGSIKDVVLGKGFLIQKSAKLSCVSFGVNSKIGKNTQLKMAIFGDFVQIGDNCVIEECIFENFIVIGNNVHLKNCFVGSNVAIEANSTVPNGSAIMSLAPSTELQAEHTVNGAASWSVSSEQKKGYYLWYLNTGKRRNKFWDLQASNLGGERRRTSSCASSTTLQGVVGGEGEAVENGTMHSLQLAKTLKGADSDTVIDVVYQGNTATFLAEVTESMLGLFEGRDFGARENLDKLKVEINSSKLAYNINTDDLAKNLFLAFLSLPKSNESFEQLKNIFEKWDPLWKNYYRKDANKLQLLHAIEEHALENEQFKKRLPKFLQYLNNEEFLKDENILEWYRSLPRNSPLTTFKLLGDLIEWIQQEESSDEDDSD